MRDANLTSDLWTARKVTTHTEAQLHDLNCAIGRDGTAADGLSIFIDVAGSDPGKATA
jgi:hypothetical protein